MTKPKCSASCEGYGCPWFDDVADNHCGKEHSDFGYSDDDFPGNEE